MKGVVFALPTKVQHITPMHIKNVGDLLYDFVSHSPISLLELVLNHPIPFRIHSLPKKNSHHATEDLSMFRPLLLIGPLLLDCWMILHGFSSRFTLDDVMRTVAHNVYLIASICA